MNKKRFYSSIVINIALSVVGVLVFLYYFRAISLEQIRYLPNYLLVYILIYILLQIVKRHLLKLRHKLDWIYYIGLLAIVLPMFFELLFSEPLYVKVVSFSSLFFLIQPLIDLAKLIKNER